MPNYHDATGGFSFLHWDVLPEMPESSPLRVHGYAKCREWIERRVRDPAMTKDVFRKTIDGFWGGKNHDLCGTVQTRMEELASAILAAGAPAEGSAEYERILAGPTDEEWAAHVAACVKEREDALWAAKCAAIRRSVEFGRLTIRQMAAYLEEMPHVEVWKAVTVLAPHLKVRKALEHAHDRLQEEQTTMPAGYSEGYCGCEECAAWSQIRWYHSCRDPHCCVQPSAADIAREERFQRECEEEEGWYS